MHISEGVLAGPVLASGAAVAAAGIGIGLKTIDYGRIPQVAVLASVFFVASLIHIPFGPSSAHLVLNGLVGLILGWGTFPALFVALALQAVLFQFGGITTLGVNTVNLALPGLICFLLFSRFVRGKNTSLAIISGFVSGAMGILLASFLVAGCLVFTGKPFQGIAKLVVVGHIPIMVIEGILTAFVVGFLRRAKPEVLGAGVK